MTEFEFQYTKPKGSALMLLTCVIACVIAINIGIYLKLQQIVIYVIAIIAIILSYQLLKKNTFGYCVAKISDTKVDFNFDENVKTINFDDLISFKAYYGSKATILYLNKSNEKFKLYANNFCKRENFDIFCKDIIIQLDNYKSNNNPNIIHEGSAYATKGMLYFLIVATFIYLFSFFVEQKDSRLSIGLAGGFFLLMMWSAYFLKRKDKSK
jgi:hypothetical protein